MGYAHKHGDIRTHVDHIYDASSVIGCGRKPSIKAMLLRRKIVSLYFCIAALFASIGAALSSPTGLNLIPTADTLPYGETSLGFSTTATRPRMDGATKESLFETEFGIGEHFEFGVDRAVGANAATLVNGKYRLYDESRLTPAVAVGMQNIATNTGSMPFIAACKTLSVARVHFGTIKTGGTFRAMLGIEKYLSRLVTIQSDYMSGAGNWTTIGMVIGVPSGWNLNAAWLIGNSDSSGNGYTIDLEWGGQLW
ncbi:MAG: hypothetical protein ABFD83_06365 [Armatimonadota bacterium]